MAKLIIDLAGERHEVDPPDVLTFGRTADLVVDESNRYLHRLVGRFFWHAESWWLENLGRSIELELVASGGSVSRLPVRQPDRDPVVAPLAGPEFRVLFEAGGLPYELNGEIGSLTLPVVETEVPPGVDTVGYGNIDVTDEEHLMLLCLAEPVLRDPTLGGADLPSSREVALKLGWSITKFNRKLDYLCARLTEAGVRGLYASREQGRTAHNRRWVLVQHAINNRLVKPVDLDTL